jgi:membrane-bound serine protease (ClpP class)
MDRKLRMARTLRALTAALAVLAAADNRADTLTKTDGKTFEGRVVAESPTHVTFESNSGGITLRQKVARTQIRSIDRPVLVGPGYCTIPISGEIGSEVTAGAFKAALDEARRNGAKYVILDIDSPGGLVAEKNKILAAMAESADLEFVAHVRRAISAAAVIAIGCPHIVMAPEASIGATVVFEVDRKGTPRNIEEKFRSVIRAQERVVAQMGNHSDLWIRGMSEIDLELHTARGADGRPVLIEGPAPEGATVVKRKGQILTLTAAEARDAGLSEATVGGVAEVRDVLGIKAWHNAGDSAGALMASRTRVRAQETAARADNVRQLKSELADIDAKLERAMNRSKAALAAAEARRAQYKADLGGIEADFNRDFDAAKHRGGVAPLKVQEAARERALACRKQYESDLAGLQSDHDAAVTEGRDLLVRRNKLITAALPTD